MHDDGLGGFGAAALHDALELLAVLAELDGLDVGADQLDVVLLQHAVLVQGDGGVQRGLPAQGRQDRVGAFLGDDLLHDLRGDRLDVGGVGELRVGHDGGRVGVDQDDPQALLLEHAQRLGAGVVEFGGLADDDRAGADDQDRLEVFALGHYFSPWVESAVAAAAFLAAAMLVDEPVEQVGGVVRAGGGLGVVLHREGRDVQAGQALDDVVVEARCG